MQGVGVFHEEVGQLSISKANAPTCIGMTDHDMDSIKTLAAWWSHWMMMIIIVNLLLNDNNQNNQEMVKVYATCLKV